ncbi:hypothetical protein SIID45300_02130 [Candidatus Magnetaquicoccaceae bacterium FCR-1]|uniref:Uncharacterized protein n=1 Tax=Candidatus Magnetaquiglobus chichijimensis TaxID=3141448 RepID=A0ABQ0CA84_9PROT
MIRSGNPNLAACLHAGLRMSNKADMYRHASFSIHDTDNMYRKIDFLYMSSPRTGVS